MQIRRGGQRLGGLGIGQRKGITETRGYLGRVRPLHLHQHIAQLIAPAAGDGNQPRLDILNLQRNSGAGPGADDVMQARQAAPQELHIAIQRHTVADLHQLIADAVAHLPPIAISRHVDHAGIEAAVAVPTHEQAQLMTVTQGTDAHADIEQFVLAGLEQLVARQRVQNFLQVLIGMTALGKTRALKHVFRLAANQRNRVRTIGVDVGGKQPQEPIGAGHAAVFGVFLHRHHVHEFRVMYGRTGVGLGHHHHPRGIDVAVQLLLRRNELIGARKTPALAHQAKALLFECPEGLAARVIRLGAAFRIAQEGEVVLIEPAQELQRFVVFVGPCRFRATAERLGNPVHVGTHAIVVRHHHAQVIQHPTHVGLQLLVGLRIGQRFEFDVHQRLGLTVAGLGTTHLAEPVIGITADSEYRVHSPVDRAARFANRHHQGIDHEGHVVDHRLQHREAMMPCGPGLIRIHHLDRRLTRLARLGELPVAVNHREQLFGAAGSQRVQRGHLVVMPHETLKQTLLSWLHLAGHQGLQLSEQKFLLLLAGALVHVSSAEPYMGWPGRRREVYARVARNPTLAAPEASLYCDAATITRVPL